MVGEDAETVARTDRMGLTYREFKNHPETSMPEFIGFPVRRPTDWQEVKRRFDPSSPGRYPPRWEALVAQGGYVPTVDHAIPPDVSHQDFDYYWARKRALLGA